MFLRCYPNAGPRSVQVASVEDYHVYYSRRIFILTNEALSAKVRLVPSQIAVAFPKASALGYRGPRTRECLARV